VNAQTIRPFNHVKEAHDALAESSGFAVTPLITITPVTVRVELQTERRYGSNARLNGRIEAARNDVVRKIRAAHWQAQTDSATQTTFTWPRLQGLTSLKLVPESDENGFERLTPRTSVESKGGEKKHSIAFSYHTALEKETPAELGAIAEIVEIQREAQDALRTALKAIVQVRDSEKRLAQYKEHAPKIREIESRAREAVNNVLRTNPRVILGDDPKLAGELAQLALKKRVVKPQEYRRNGKGQTPNAVAGKGEQPKEKKPKEVQRNVRINFAGTLLDWFNEAQAKRYPGWTPIHR